ncbi:ABC transporter ATP-binding protein [Dechloromonas sp. ZY10]|uniref:ABC transporter ATP-binding protein n=1 Tax=Dechloromonas aquae TaxID=2664436 RepID=UPI00352860CD
MVPAANPTLAVRALRYQWPGHPDFVLNVPDFTVDRGQSLFLHGPSGSGKSTLLNLLGGVLQPQAGHIELLGQVISDWPARRRDAFRADHIGFIFQQFNLIPYLSLLDNVLLPCRFSRRRADRAGQPVEAAAALLHALEIATELHARPAHTLSVGQQQRVAAARALIGGPEILIADEPTSALDAGRQSAFVDLLLAQASAHHSSVVLVSHDLHLARHFSAVRALNG